MDMCLYACASTCMRVSLSVALFSQRSCACPKETVKWPSIIPNISNIESSML